MKLVLFSDLHLDAPFAWLSASPLLARRRRQALRQTLQRVVALVEEVRAEALLCGGDLYEQERFSSDTAAFLRSTFARLHPLRVFLAPGNHDWYGAASLYHQVEWSPNVHVFREDRLEPVSLAAGLTLWGAAHRAPAATAGFLERFRVDRDGVHLALFHGSEQGGLIEQEEGKAPHAPFQRDQIGDSGLHHAFLGHYHRPRDGAVYTYPGNPEPLAFGEDGERGAVVATIGADGSVHRVRRPVAVTAWHDLVVDVDGCVSQDEVRERVASALSDRTGVVRVTVRGEVGADASVSLPDLEAIPADLEGLVVRAGDLRPAYDLSAIAAEPTVRGQFVREVQAAALPEDERRRVLITGLRALDGRDDLEVP